MQCHPHRSILFPYTTLFRSQVTAGETAQSIADKFGIRKKDFLMLNNFPESVKLKPGDVVLIRQLKNGESQDMGEANKTDRKSTRLNSSHRCISYAVFCLKKK